MTQRDLAAATGIPQPAIARIERGAASPRVDTLERLMAGTGNALEVAPRLGIGIDRTLIRESLRWTPEQRVSAAAAAASNLVAFLTAHERARRR